MGSRTRAALGGHGLVDHAHRSRQFRRSDGEAADLVVVMEPLHLHWMRRNCPEAAAVTGSLRRLARDLAAPTRPSLSSRPGLAGGNDVGTRASMAGDCPARASLADACDLGPRVAALGLSALAPEPWEEVVDPAAGDQAAFDRCAAELSSLVAELYRRL